MRVKSLYKWGVDLVDHRRHKSNQPPIQVVFLRPFSKFGEQPLARVERKSPISSAKLACRVKGENRKAPALIEIW